MDSPGVHMEGDNMEGGAEYGRKLFASLLIPIEEDMGGDMNGEGGMAVEGMDGQMEGGSPGGEGQMMNEEEFKQHQEEMYMQQQRQMEYMQ
jgi:hypothetical protein